MTKPTDDYQRASRAAAGLTRRLIGLGLFHFGLVMVLVAYPTVMFALPPAATWVLLTLWCILVVVHFNLLVLRSRIDELLFHLEWVNRDAIARREE